MAGCLPFLLLSCHKNTPAVTGLSNQIVQEKSLEPPPVSIVLEAGDEISINVWRNDTLNRSLKIDPTGMIQFPLVGKVHAAGMTTDHLSAFIANKLSKYLIDPQVDVNATSLKNHKVYVLGEVKNPGVITLDHPLSLWEALASTGGFTNDANQQQVLLFRKDQEGIKTTSLNLDLASQKFAMDSYLKDNDIVFVPTSLIADWSRFALHFSSILSPIIGVEQAIVLLPQTIDALKGTQQNGSVVVPH